MFNVKIISSSEKQKIHNVLAVVTNDQENTMVIVPNCAHQTFFAKSTKVFVYYKLNDTRYLKKLLCDNFFLSVEGGKVKIVALKFFETQISFNPKIADHVPGWNRFLENLKKDSLRLTWMDNKPQILSNCL